MVSLRIVLLFRLMLMRKGECAPALTTPNFDIWNDTNVNLDAFNIAEMNPASNSNNNTQRYARVLNFFPVPVEEECLSNDKRRKGVCMNAYECRIQSGSSHGPCALGFGVCCVFTATCNGEIFNNLTYFVNPDFPDLSKNMTDCTIKVKKIDPEISQLRLDFIHFNLGQPNRKTGVCEEDIFTLASTEITRELKLCGLNSGQHAYFDVDDIETSISISVNLSRKAVARLWEVRITQVPFTERAPAGCLQYHTGASGTIQTMNFADNGRHLADQDYNICMRQEAAMCTIVYEPCHDNAFRIGPNTPPEEPAANATASDDFDEGGSGQGDAASGRLFDACNDRIVLPCDSDDLIVAGEAVPAICDVVHCGPTLCPSGESPCRLESSVTPFTVGVHFGASARNENPEENLGMCLNYEQLPCNV